MIKSSLFNLAFLFSVAVLPLAVSSVSAEIANESSLIAKGGDGGGHGGGGGGGHGGGGGWGGGGHHGGGDWNRGGGDWDRGGGDWNRGGDWGGGSLFYLNTGYPYSGGYNDYYSDPYYYYNTGPGLYFGY